MSVDLLQVAGGAAVLAGGVAGVVYLGRGAWRATGSLHRLATGLLGDAEQGSPGVIERLDGIDQRLDQFHTRLHGVEAQLSPNGGRSLHDRIAAIERQTCPGREG